MGSCRALFSHARVAHLQALASGHTFSPGYLQRLLFSIDVLLRTAASDCVLVLGHDKRWVIAVVLVNILQGSVGWMLLADFHFPGIVRTYQSLDKRSKGQA